MEAELHYFSGVFKGRGLPAKEQQEEPSVYAEVKTRQPAAAPAAAGEAAARAHFPSWLLCSAGLFVLLLASAVAVTLVLLQVTKQEAEISRLTAENEQLMVEKSLAENHSENLSWTLGVILDHRRFPVADFCPNKRCRPCRDNWIRFRDSCYLFYNGGGWKTWRNSAKTCRDAATHLAVVDDQEEQEFLSRNIEYYFDEYHGFWIGLSAESNTWTWVDGRNDTPTFWMNPTPAADSGCVLMLPQDNVTDNWRPVGCTMRNKFICEGDVLIRTRLD